VLPRVFKFPKAFKVARLVVESIVNAPPTLARAVNPEIDVAVFPDNVKLPPTVLNEVNTPETEDANVPVNETEFTADVRLFSPEKFVSVGTS
jgi:hypothetical protein